MRDELTPSMIEQAKSKALDYATSGWHRKVMQETVELNGGSISKALKNIDPWVSETLGNQGMAQPAFEDFPALYVRISGTVKSSEGAEVWIGNSWDCEPDLIVTWREIFEHACGRPKQMRLF